MGRHTKRGGYFIEWEKVRSFVVPDLTDFKVQKIGRFGRWIREPGHLYIYARDTGRGTWMTNPLFI